MGNTWKLASPDLNNTVKLDVIASAQAQSDGFMMSGTLTFKKTTHSVKGYWAFRYAPGAQRQASAFGLVGTGGPVFIVASGIMKGGPDNPPQVDIQLSTASATDGTSDRYKGVLLREPVTRVTGPTIDLYFRPRLNKLGNIVGFKIEYDNSDDRHVLMIGGSELTLRLHNESGLAGYTWGVGNEPTIHGTAEPFIRASWPFKTAPKHPTEQHGWSPFIVDPDGLSATYTNKLIKDTTRAIASPPTKLGLTYAPAHYQYGVHIYVPKDKLPIQLKPNATDERPAGSGSYYYTYAEDPEMYVDEC